MATTGDGSLLPASPRLDVPESRFAPPRPIGPWGFLGVAVVSFGGPLSLAALYAPGLLDDTSASAGLVAIAAAVVFGIPMVLWLKYAGQIATAGGLFGFVEAAAGRRVAMVQAVLWIASYALYLVYTTAQIVYDTLPEVLPGVRGMRPALEIAIPVVLAAVMLAGRTATIGVLGALAVVQVGLVIALAAVTIGHAAPASSFAANVGAGDFGSATGGLALLYICGTLPLFLGGEVVRPTRTVRAGMGAAYAIAAVAVVATVFPLAANPAFTRAEIPGMSIAEVFAGHGLAVAIGLGVAASIAGGMLVEYLALSRLLHAVTRQPVGPIVTVLAGLMVVTAPLSLIDPDRFYEVLLRPSLIALWLSQLVVFLVYPRFAIRRGGRRTPAFLLAGAASAFALYGLYASTGHLAT